MEAVESDDELIVVIVGDGEEIDKKNNRRKQVFKVKDDAVVQPLDVEDLIETAEKHGQLIQLNSVKEEPTDDSFITNEIKEEPEDDYEEEQYYDDTDEEYVPEFKDDYSEEEEEDDNESYNKKQKKYFQRHKLRGPDYSEEEEEDDNESYNKKQKKYFQRRNKKQKKYFQKHKLRGPDYSEEEEEDDNESYNKKEKKYFQRHKLRGPDEQKSFVKDLCEQYPELAEDKELLINTLCGLMVQVKPPELPEDYFMMNEDKFQCIECGSLKESIPAAGRHWQEKHGPRYLICYSCGVDFRSKTNLYKHEKRCPAPDAVTVLKARARSLGRKGRSRPFLQATDFLLIRQGDHKQKKYDRYHCSQCTADFVSKRSLEAHEFAHRGARPYKCLLCPAAYTSYTGLHRHTKIKHSDEKYICDVCSRVFKSKTALIAHLDTHKPLRKWECSICGRRYAQKMAMQLHMDRLHYNLPPPCACKICPKRYPRMSLLKAHMLRDHGMNLITRKMFYKALPMLSETQLKEAKIIMKSELQDERGEVYHYQNQSQMDADSEEEQTVEECQDEHDASEELKQYMSEIEAGGLDENTHMIIIDNGEVVYVDESNIDLYRDQLAALEEYQSQEIDEDNKEDIQRQLNLIQEESNEAADENASVDETPENTETLEDDHHSEDSMENNEIIPIEFRLPQDDSKNASDSKIVKTDVPTTEIPPEPKSILKVKNKDDKVNIKRKIEVNNTDSLKVKEETPRKSVRINLRKERK